MSGQFSFLAVRGAAEVEPNSGASVRPLGKRVDSPGSRFNQVPGWIEPAALARRALTVETDAVTLGVSLAFTN